jgi:hypothetical protein
MSDPNKGAWGTGKFGGDAEAFYGAAGPFELEFAYATSERSLRVGLTREPQNLHPFMPGDVLRPLTWTVTRLDTGKNLYVVGVTPFEKPKVWDIVTRDRLGTVVVQHRVQTTTLRSRAGLVIGAPNTLDFVGVKNTNNLHPLAPEQGVVDIENRSFGEGTAWRIGPSGLYTLESKVPALKKRMLRMLSSEPGSWSGDPDFGVGLKPKEPLPEGDIISLERNRNRF